MNIRGVNPRFFDGANPCWCIIGDFDGEEKMWTGNGWTTTVMRTRYAGGIEADIFENPDDAQSMADSFHLADCNFSHVMARETESKFVVRNFHTGEVYKPKPLVRNKFIFAREKEVKNG